MEPESAFWILIVNLIMLPFIYFKQYRSYNCLALLGILATVAVAFIIMISCVVLKLSKTKNIHEPAKFDVD